MRGLSVILFGAVSLSIGLGLPMGCSIDGSSEGQLETETAAQPSSSSSTPSSGTSSTPPSASPSSGTLAGFVWKPISEGDGNLVVLLPAGLRGAVVGTDIVRGGGVVERGRFAGDSTNGGRPQYRFSMPGSGYGSGLTLVARLTDGTTQRWSISNGGTRVG